MRGFSLNPWAGKRSTNVDNPPMDVQQPGADVRSATAYYERVAPILDRLFRGTPVVAAAFPVGPETPAVWIESVSDTLPAFVRSIDVRLPHSQGHYVKLSTHALLWMFHRYGAMEFHTWSPTADDPLRLRFARILLEPDAATPLSDLAKAAVVVREVLESVNVVAIPVHAGSHGLSLWIPFCDAPDYPQVRSWLHTISAEAVRRAPDLLTEAPLTASEGRVHLHVSSNAPGRFSALPYSLRYDEHLTVCAPVSWDELDTIALGSIRADSIEERLNSVGEIFGAQVRSLASQTFAGASAKPVGALVMPTPAVQPQRGHVLSAVLDILSDGVVRSADEILAEALKRGTLPADMTRKYVYTALIEYIARTEGRKRKPLIVQDPDRRFRINEPADDWPDAVLPKRPVPAGAEALCARLEGAAHGDDPAGFERAACDAFTMLGFVATHLGGNDAPDGYADAVLGPLQYRVMLECKTARSQVTQPDCFEASKYREQYGADYCVIVGPEFSGELELASELQTHAVCAVTVADLQALLRAGADAVEVKQVLEPGFASDRIGDLLWERKHGRAKRLSVICDYLRRTGWAMQLMAAQSNARGDAAAITVDVAIALVDGALAEGGRHVGCSRSEITDAFSYLTSSLVAAAVWSSSERDAIVITNASPA